ncbi:transcriptional regulator with XRE-family HTH domain [Haloferula luteola]|uniref:Transcriptional regulator with XRE-family HTH domain n=1 Tax=Haloferula luteola TaxID=595692 RepID=A0A840VMI7_9BACT|nr:helix-turn-helix transcriptional regulator [Haloferula luteola]MBB5353841.1 transcriptional regulator with XRE-family HTH domain [Haloferula luteola]
MESGQQNLVGTRVRKLRLGAELSQETFAARCQTQGWDVSRGTFAKIEAGLRRVTDAELVIMAKVLRCSVERLLEGLTSKEISRVLRQGE